MRTIFEGITEPLREPFMPPSNSVIRGCHFRIDAANFSVPDPTKQPSGAVRIDKGIENVIIEDCTFEGLPDHEWVELQKAPGKWWASWLRGIAIHEGRGIEIRNCRILRFPREGIFTQDVSDLWIERVLIEYCWGGIGFDWPRLRPNSNLTILDVWVNTTRALTETMLAIGPSILEPGGWVGGNFGAFGGCDGVTVKRFRSIGEGKGFKFIDSTNVLIEDMRTPQLWIGGFDPPPVPGWGEQYKGPMETRNIVVRDSVLGESTWGFGRTQTSDPTTLYCNYKTEDEVLVENCVLLAPRPGPLWSSAWKDAAGNPIPAPNFDRHAVVQAYGSFKLLLKDTRIIDQYPLVKPAEVYADTGPPPQGGAVVRQENVTTERLEQLWRIS